MSSANDTLVLAWGNPGRRDDGLGPAFAARLAVLGVAGVTIESDYQLAIEDAAEVARHRRVVFVDAERTGNSAFTLRPLAPTCQGLSFSSHSVSPGALLALTRDLFHTEPEAWLLGIRGYEFDRFDEGLSGAAEKNLDAAVEFVLSALGADPCRDTIESRTEAALPFVQEDAA